MKQKVAAGLLLLGLLGVLSPCASLSPTPDLLYEAGAKTDAARYYLKQARYDKAAQTAESALSDWRRLRGGRLRGNDLWVVEKGIEACEEILETCRRPSERTLRNTLHRAWDTYLAGDYQKARAAYEHSLKVIERELGPDHRLLAQCLGSLGNVYNAVGAYDRAETLYRRALAIREQDERERRSGGLASSLHDLAWLYECRGQYEKALPLYQRARELPGYWHPVLLENNLASCYLAMGRVEEACEVFKRTGLALGRGACHYHRGEYDEAVRDFERALEDEDPRIRGYRVMALISLGWCYEAKQDLDEAEWQYRRAVEHIETEWRNLDSVERRNFLGAHMGGGMCRLEAYEGLVRVLMRQKPEGYEAETLGTAERVKARTFLEMLATRRVQGAPGADRDVLERDRRFQQEIADARKRLESLRKEGKSGARGEFRQAEQELERSLGEYERFINEVKLRDAELASLISVDVPTLERIQDLLPEELTVVEFFTGEACAWAWLITREDVQVHELEPGRDRLADLANRLRVDVRHKRGRRAKPLLVVVPEEEGGAPEGAGGLEDRGKGFRETGRELYRLLIEPLEPGIRTRDLAIVPHGVLHKVPFAALHNGRSFLVERFSHCVVPSLSAIEYVAGKRKPQGKALTALADPKTELPALAFAEKEVLEIGDFFPQKAIYLHEEATETRARERSRAGGVLHVASHGEFNDRQPMQSGLILTGDGQNDGFLQVHEIFGLDLRKTNLVTLSACDTALSRIYNGDDLVGLSRAFIYAGAPALLASLWPVEDRSTYLLMKAFYRNWASEGASPTRALRRAQLELRARPGYEHPFHWAPFILIGDWQ